MALFDPEGAVTVVFPFARAVTSPVAFTLATAASPTDHVVLLDGSGDPSASVAVDVNWRVSPSAFTPTLGGLIVIVAATCRTVAGIDAVKPSAVAVMFALPLLFAVA